VGYLLRDEAISGEKGRILPAPFLEGGEDYEQKEVSGDPVKGCRGGVGDLWVGLQGVGQKISTGQMTAFFLYHLNFNDWKKARVQMEHLSINPQDIEYPTVAIAGLAMDPTDQK
jgi:hypothetical protein